MGMVLGGHQLGPCCSISPWQKGSVAEQQILQSLGTALGASCGELQGGLVTPAMKQLESFLGQQGDAQGTNAVLILHVKV